MASSDPDRIERIGVAPNEAIALHWRELLAADDIVVLIKVGGPGLAYFSPALCEHYLFARAADAARARQLLADYAAAPNETTRRQDDET